MSSEEISVLSLREMEDSKHIALNGETSTLEGCAIVSAEPCVYQFEETVYEVDEFLTTATFDEEECLSDVPLVSATPLHQPILHPVLNHTSATRPHNTPVENLADQGVNPLITIRPEFIFASALLQGTSSDDLGIVLENRAKGGVIVAGLSHDSPFLGSLIQPGDHIVAINNLLCADYCLDRVQDLMRASKDKVSICVHNANGDPTLVSSSIMKPEPSAKVGITLKRRYDVIRVKELTEHSLFGDALLTPKQRCIFINGIPCEQLTAHSASVLIGAATNRVTIVSEIQASCAVTIALYEHVAWWRKVAGVVHALSPGSHS